MSPGFQRRQVAAVDLLLPSAVYTNGRQQRAFYRQVLENVVSVPGVTYAGYSSGIPLTRVWDWAPAVPEGSTVSSLETMDPSRLTAFLDASSGYFSAMGIVLRRGRLYADEGEVEQVAVVSETAALRFWPGEDAIGKRVRHSLGRNYRRVVGVVADVRMQGLDREAQSVVYRSYFQSNGGDESLVLRTALPPTTLSRLIREAVWKVDRSIPVPEIRTMNNIVADSVAPRRFQALLVAVFAIFSLGLACVGIYGVVSYVAVQRRTEIGVRLALGATPREICLLMLSGGMQPVLIGLAGGVLGSLAITRWIQALLFEVRPTDPGMISTAGLVLGLAALLACYVPARRACRLDASDALRQL